MAIPYRNYIFDSLACFRHRVRRQAGAIYFIGLFGSTIWISNEDCPRASATGFNPTVTSTVSSGASNFRRFSGSLFGNKSSHTATGQGLTFVASNQFPMARPAQSPLLTCDGLSVPAPVWTLIPSHISVGSRCVSLDCTYRALNPLPFNTSNTSIASFLASKSSGTTCISAVVPRNLRSSSYTNPLSGWIAMNTRLGKSSFCIARFFARNSSVSFSNESERSLKFAASFSNFPARSFASAASFSALAVSFSNNATYSPLSLRNCVSDLCAKNVSATSTAIAPVTITPPHQCFNEIRIILA